MFTTLSCIFEKNHLFEYANNYDNTISFQVKSYIYKLWYQSVNISCNNASIPHKITAYIALNTFYIEIMQWKFFNTSWVFLRVGACKKFSEYLRLTRNGQ